MLVRVRVLPGWPLSEYRQPQNNLVFSLEPQVVEKRLVEETTWRQPFMEIVPVKNDPLPAKAKEHK